MKYLNKNRMEKEELEEVLRLAENFRNATLGSVKPNGKCFSLSYPLSLHLENNNLNNYITAGYFKNVSKSHFWLTLEKNTEIIVDITKDQFYKKAPKVFIGKKPDDYFITEIEFEKLIEEVYNAWIIPFKYSENFKDYDIDVLLEINLRAAIILNNELDEKKRDFNISLRSKIYFIGIFEILNIFQDRLEVFENIIGFNELKLKAIKHQVENSTL